MFETFTKFKDLINQNTLFWFCALLGSGMFIIQFLLTLLGNIDHADSGDTELNTIHFKWMSKQALTGFLMMFGWSALACQHQFSLPRSITLVIALVAGVVTAVINGFIFKMARKLHSPGSVFRLEDTVGKEATVYLRIPKGGVGKISISLHQITHEVDAMAQNEEELPSFTPVRVVKKADDKTVIVIQNLPREPVSDNVGQPQNLNPPASPNLFKWSCFGAGKAWLKFRAPPCQIPDSRGSFCILKFNTRKHIWILHF
jgi:hypothetical protein